VSATSEQLWWLCGNDTGVSSATIWAVMTGEQPGRYGYADRPHDPGDLGRCIRLLDLFPEWRARLPEVAEAYPAWTDLVAEWRALEASYRAEEPTGRAPATYALMRSLAARRCCCGAVRPGESIPGEEHESTRCHGSGVWALRLMAARAPSGEAP
jgi:hypothetical protein